MPKDRPHLDELLKRLDKLLEDPGFWEKLKTSFEQADKLAKELEARARFPQPDPHTKLFGERRPKFRQARLCRA